MPLLCQIRLTSPTTSFGCLVSSKSTSCSAQMRKRSPVRKWLCATDYAEPGRNLLKCGLIWAGGIVMIPNTRSRLATTPEHSSTTCATIQAIRSGDRSCTIQYSNIASTGHMSHPLSRSYIPISKTLVHCGLVQGLPERSDPCNRTRLQTVQTAIQEIGQV